MEITRVSTVILVVFLWISGSLAQTKYVKAKSPLQARIAKNTLLKQSASSRSKTLSRLAVGTVGVVSGRIGPWLDIEIEGQKGWVLLKDIKILGVVTQESQAQSAPESAPSPVESKASRKRPSRHPWTLFAGYGYALKSIENTFRVGGGYSVYDFDRNVSLDLTAGADFLSKDKLFYFAPSLVNDLQIHFLKARLGITTSMALYYLIPEVGDSDVAIGAQFGPVLFYGRRSQFALQIPIETILFGATRTRVSIVPTLGYRF